MHTMKLLEKFFVVILREDDVEEEETDKRAARSNETFSGAYFFLFSYDSVEEIKLIFISGILIFLLCFMEITK